jgi:hypothetical protein
VSGEREAVAAALGDVPRRVELATRTMVGRSHGASEYSEYPRILDAALAATAPAHDEAAGGGTGAGDAADGGSAMTRRRC